MVSGDCPARRGIAPLLEMTSIELIAELLIPMLLVQVFHLYAGREPLPTRKVELRHLYLTPMNGCLYFSIHGEPRFYFFDCRS